MAQRRADGPQAPPSPRTVLDYLRLAEPYLARHGVASARLDAEVLLAHVLGVSRLELYTRLDQPLVQAEVDAYREALLRRARREPVAYITGVKEFYGLPFRVGPGVLVPRPETEFLVEQVLALLGQGPGLGSSTAGGSGAAGGKNPAAGAPTGAGAATAAGLPAAAGQRAGPSPAEGQGAAPGAGLVVDVGTGCGAIALAVAYRHPGVAVMGIDRSAAALAYARANGERLGLGRRVRWLLGDGLEALADASAAVVVANPPYVPTDRLPELAPEIARHEPKEALDGGPDGLDVARRILAAAQRVLSPGGTLLMELGDRRQAEQLAEWARQNLTGGQRGPGGGSLEICPAAVDPVTGAVAFVARRRGA